MKLNKKISALCIIAFFCSIVLFGSRYILGFSLWRIGDAITVATGMGAKLGCSSRFVSHATEVQITHDLASYSPVNRYLKLHYDMENKTVSASLFGMANTSATYRIGLGCTLNVGNTAPLDSITAPPIAVSPSMPWPRGEHVMSIQPTRQSMLNALLTQDNTDGLNTRALLLVENGEITAESYAQGYDQKSRLLGWSMGKSVTAIMLGRMAYLDMATMQQAQLFPHWVDERKHITLEHILQMSSGLMFDETYAPGSDATDMLFSDQSASELALHKSLAFQPGEHFSYSSGTTNILMRWMYENVNSNTQQLSDFFRHEILQPLSLGHTVFEPDPSGVFVGSSYIYASARDWARLGLLMLNKGTINGQRVLSEAWVSAAIAENSSENYPGYGYYFWLNKTGNGLRWPELPTDAYFMMGNRKQYVMVVPSKNIVMVRLGWTKGDYPVAKNFSTLINN